ncbi:class I SAM-dependent methyltransferase [Thermoflexus sp.]|uniref:class I SAM-dependent methyltransferase n=1 Tax=Thermoflexus sp. TaxID=1969742 RepID=UPI0035E45813
MKWTQEEITLLSPVLERFEIDLKPLDGKSILVLCSSGGDVAFWLARRMKKGKVIGVELDPQLLERARQQVNEQGLERIVEFHQAEKTRSPFPDSTFDALVSEFVVFPTPAPTEIGQPEMARVLKSGGLMALTDVIVVKPLPQDVRTELRNIGLDYLCEATQDDFLRWMEEAGLVETEVADLTPVVRRVWERRRQSVSKAEEPKGFTYLLDDPNFGLGSAIFYIYVRGKKP